MLPPERQPDQIRQMFGRIAPRYDLANHLLSCGLDFWWRKRAAEILATWKARSILDVATGSGDLALAIQRRLPEAKIIGTDFSPEMLAIARGKGVLNTVVADALQLPFANASFDCVTVAFGLRNMADWGAALREFARVLAPGGHLLVLEFSLPPQPIRTIYRLYLHYLMPAIAAALTRQKNAYKYLGASIENFPRGGGMVSLLEANGFRNATFTSLTGGVVTLYTAAKA